MTPEQLQIIQHSLGVDKYGRGRRYRNHFVTERAGENGIICESLVALGFMCRVNVHSDLTGGMQCYSVTPAGNAAVLDSSPKLTKSQERYQEFLNADSGLTFMQWLKRRKHLHPFATTTDV